MRSGEITHTEYHKKWGERNYTNEVRAPLNQPKPLMNMCRALKSVPDIEFKLSKEALPRVFNLSKAGQLKRKCSIVFNSFLIVTCPAIIWREFNLGTH